MRKLIFLALALCLSASVAAEPKRLEIKNDNYTVSNIIAAQEYTQRAIFGPNSWQNYNLTEEDLKAMAKDEPFIPEYRKLKPRVLIDVNRVRELAGLPRMFEKQIKIYIREYWSFTPWTDESPWRTSGKLTGKTKLGYLYEEQKNELDVVGFQPINPNEVIWDKPMKGKEPTP